MTQPTFLVEVAFASDPFDASPVWVDITPYVRHLDRISGRQFELDRVEASVLTLEVEDEDRRFDATNVASPYYPNVVPMRPVRYTVVHDGVNYRRFQGFVEAWPQRWEGGGDPSSVVLQLRCVDLFKILARANLVSPYAVEVLADDPLVYYRFRDEPIASGGGAFLSDETSAALAGYVVGATHDYEDVAMRDGTGCYRFDGIGNYGIVPAPGRTPGGSFAIEVWYDMTAAVFGNLWQLGQTGTYWLSLDSLAAASAGKLQFIAFGEDHSELQVLGNPTATNNGAWHHVVCQYNASTLLLELYVDSVLVDSQTAAATIDPPDVGIVLAAGWIGSAAACGLDEFAVYDHVLTPARITAHYAARTLRAGELSGARIGYILDRVGWPATPRSIDPGQSTLAAADLEGVSALEALHQVAESEAGVFFVAGDGSPTFFDRYDRITAPKDAPQATFGDGGGAEVDYEVVELSYDEERIYNEIRETNAGTLIVREDLDSQEAYGRRTLEQRTDLEVAAEAIDRADFSLRRYKDPRVRCETISFGPVYANAEWAVLLSRGIGDRARIMRRPPTGATVQRDVFVEQIIEAVDGAAMSLGFQLSPAEDWNFWVLGDAAHGVLDTTTVVGF